MGIDEPDMIRLSSLEFIDKLNGEYKTELRREYNRVVFSKDPQKYKRMGLNEYLERDIECKEEIVIPLMDKDVLMKLASQADVSIKIDRFNKDPNVMILLANGTRTGIKSLKSKFGTIHNRLPSEMQISGDVSLIDVPVGMEDAVIGRNGVNIYKIQKRFGVTIRTMDRDVSKVLVISGSKEKTQDACKYILDIVYKDKVI